MILFFLGWNINGKWCYWFMFSNLWKQVRILMRLESVLKYDYLYYLYGILFHVVKGLIQLMAESYVHMHTYALVMTSFQGYFVKIIWHVFQCFYFVLLLIHLSMVIEMFWQHFLFPLRYISLSFQRLCFLYPYLLLNKLEDQIL